MVVEVFKSRVVLVLVVLGVSTELKVFSKRHAIPAGKRLCGREFTLVQDNDPKHSSTLCKKYLKKKETQGELKLMNFSLQSPDVNPIGHFMESLKDSKSQTCCDKQG